VNSDEARREFRRASIERKLIDRGYARFCKKTQREWEDFLIALAKAAKPRVRKWDEVYPGEKRVLLIGKIIGAIGGQAVFDAHRAPIAAMAEASGAIVAALKKSYDDGLNALAEIASVVPGNDFILYDRCHASSYMSQGYGKERYAKGSVHLSLSALAENGFETKLEEKRETRESGFVSVEFFGYVKVANSIDVEILKRKPLQTLRNWLKAAHKFGVEPRVYNPFLPYDIEEKLGLDHFGNDKEPSGKVKIA
jgi:hypothetical protein